MGGSAATGTAAGSKRACAPGAWAARKSRPAIEAALAGEALQTLRASRSRLGGELRDFGLEVVDVSHQSLLRLVRRCRHLTPDFPQRRRLLPQQRLRPIIVKLDTLNQAPHPFHLRSVLRRVPPRRALLLAPEDGALAADGVEVRRAQKSAARITMYRDNYYRRNQHRHCRHRYRRRSTRCPRPTSPLQHPLRSATRVFFCFWDRCRFQGGTLSGLPFRAP